MSVSTGVKLQASDIGSPFDVAMNDIEEARQQQQQQQQAGLDDEMTDQAEVEVRSDMEMVNTPESVSVKNSDIKKQGNDDDDDEQQQNNLEYRNFPVVLQTDSASFLLYSRLNENEEEEKEEEEEDPPILNDFSFVTGPLEGLFQALRLSFQDNFISDDELRFEIPSLGLVIGEDDVYSREVSLYDIIELYGMINDNTPSDDKSMVLTVELYAQTRFISRFNSISTMIKEGKGMSAVREFLEQEDGSSSSSSSSPHDNVDVTSHGESPEKAVLDTTKFDQEEEVPADSHEPVLDTTKPEEEAEEDLSNINQGLPPAADQAISPVAVVVSEEEKVKVPPPGSPLSDGELSLLSTPRQEPIAIPAEEGLVVVADEEEEEDKTKNTITKRSLEEGDDQDKSEANEENSDAKRRRSDSDAHDNE